MNINNEHGVNTPAQSFALFAFGYIGALLAVSATVALVGAAMRR